MELQVSNLAVARAGVRLLEGLGFGLAAGQGLALRGPNGIGKTTLLRVIAGLQPALAGRVVAGEVAYGGHSDGVKATLSVAENLAFWAAIYGTGGGEAALRAMNLGHLAGRRAADLSAGQRRRLGLARFIVSGRRVWLMDEPTVSLDAASVGLFAESLAAHLAAGGVAVVATHIDLGIALAPLDLTAFRARAAGGGGGAGGFDEAIG